MNKSNIEKNTVNSSRPRANRSKNRGLTKIQLFIIIGAFIIVILGILAVPYYQTYIKPFSRTVIFIDNTKISMRYFIEQIKANDSDPMSMLTYLTQQELVKIMAPRYSIRVTSADVDRYLRAQAESGGEPISDVEYREWYRQKLNEIKLSDSQYKESVSYTILVQRLQQYMAARVTTVMPQVHLNWIVTLTQEDANQAVARIKAGESFADVAKEVSLDENTKDTGGDLGWIPPEISTYESTILALDINEVSDPVAYFSQDSSSSSQQQTEPECWYIFMVSERDSAHELDANSLSIMKDKALDDWFNEESKNHNIRYDFNSEIYAWINYQLQKGSTSSTTTTTTTGGSSGY